MLRASSTFLHGGGRAHRQLAPCQRCENNVAGSTRRLLSFKAFTERSNNTAAAAKRPSETTQGRKKWDYRGRRKVERTVGGNIDGLIRQNNNAKNHNNRFAGPVGQQNNNAGPPPPSADINRTNRPSYYNQGEARHKETTFVPPSSSRPSSSNQLPPWQQRRQQRTGGAGAPNNTSLGMRPGNRYNNQQYGNMQNNTNRPPSHNKQQTSRPGGGDDLRDISGLRDTFIKNPSNNRNRGREQPWRSGNGGGGRRYDNLPSHQQPLSYSRQPPSPNTASSYTTPVSNITLGGSSVDNTAAASAAGVGVKFQPSFYKKKTPPPPSPSRQDATTQLSGMPTIPTIGGQGIPGSSGNEAKSIEQVMRDNAHQRKLEMEQRHLNAGERVPYQGFDMYGNVQRDVPRGQYAWRNRANNNANYSAREGSGRGGGGRYRRPKFQNRQQPQFGRQQHDPFGERKRSRQKQMIRRQLPSSLPKEVRLPSQPMTLVDLSLLLRVKKRAIVRTLRALGESISYSDAKQDSYTIDVEMMEYICVELGIDPLKSELRESSLEEAERRALRQGSSATNSEEEEVDEVAKTEEEERYAALPPRSPVVSIMGHVDHGKTTLMDALRGRAVTGDDNTARGAAGKASKKKKRDKGKSKQRGKGGVNVADGNVAGTEAGGITQVITAFEVPLPFSDEGEAEEEEQQLSTVTFLDTPGHAAFKKMRQSGSYATDVIVLVIAADDGVSPQTIEIIDMYKSIARAQPTSISLVIAVSKIDKPGVDVDEAVRRIEYQLMEHEIFTENIGDEGEFGACQLFPVSGITGDGLDDLIEGLALQSEIMDLRADVEAKGQGIVIDARMERGLGVVADCVIRWGSVGKGDFVVSGTNGGRVKFLNDVGNNPLERGMPSQPVRIVGFKSLPKAGDPIVCASSEDEAKEIIRLRESELFNEERAEFDKNDVELQVSGTAAKNGLMMQKAQEHYGFDGSGEMDENESIRIPVVIKADSHGALDAVRDALVSIGTTSKLDIVIDPVEMSTGVVTYSDVVMAKESDAGIFFFGNSSGSSLFADKETKKQAGTDSVSVRSHDIIYRLLEDAKEFFGRYLPVELVEVVHGKAQVQAVFDVTDAKSKKAISIAGLRVAEGNLFKDKSVPGGGGGGGEPLSCYYRVFRKGEMVTEAEKKVIASSLRKVKEDVDSVRNGEECGLGLVGFNDLEEGDVVECYSIEEKRAVI